MVPHDDEQSLRRAALQPTAADAAAGGWGPIDAFVPRHIGSTPQDIAAMLDALGVPSVAALVERIVPETIALDRPLHLAGLPAPEGAGETATLARLRQLADKNRPLRAFIGMGYTPCLTPAVILRNVLENPGWYTQYTPYQAEISQGRLEALLNFQTLVADLTGLQYANASLLDEATAAAEAMAMCHVLAPGKNTFYTAANCHPQTLAVVRTRAESMGFTLKIGEPDAAAWGSENIFGVLAQYPDTFGHVADYAALAGQAHAHGAYLVVACDLLSLALLRPPGEFGADVAVGTAQRFGVPLGFGGPHAAFLSTHPAFKRAMPGRIIGVARDARGKPALRMALQTREQHIRRERATSNICTAQALLANMASFYAVYHGPAGLKAIAQRVHGMARSLAVALEGLGYTLRHATFFDTLVVQRDAAQAAALVGLGVQHGLNLRAIDGYGVGVTLDEACTQSDVDALCNVFALHAGRPVDGLTQQMGLGPHAARFAWPQVHCRQSTFLQHPVFNSYHTEHEMLRYMQRLQGRDLSLAHGMIPLGSCTMKLNATSEMLPITWPQFASMHPFAPAEQTRGYRALCLDLETWLAEITGFAAVSLQPNAGAQGEYAGLMVIRAWHRSRAEAHRNVCLIPTSAHGTNPASAAMAGMRVVAVACDARGNVDRVDLADKARAHSAHLAALMVTYPSTHGVFEAGIKDICATVHAHGGQVYLDGANMNAQVGLCRPGDFGADVCHLNLHKTFCIPHGGGGPGVGPIAAAAHLAAFLPQHPVVDVGHPNGMGPVAAAPWGSAGILPIAWMYIAMMGAQGLLRATQVAILHANYMVWRLKDDYKVLYTDAHGRVAHEFILDLRPLKATANVEAEDVAKRLMDYGFHAPTMSFPVAGTLMVEPTESESLRELDRFCDALLSIRHEIDAIAQGRMDKTDNLLKNAPHTADMVCAEHWPHPYTRTQAAYPTAWLKEHKFWPSVGRIDNAYGDRNLICTCPPVSAYEA